MADVEAGRARVVCCPDCGQLEIWSEEEAVNDHGKCRASAEPCWCETEGITMEQQTVTSIRVVERKCDLRDFVNPDGDQTPEQVERAMTTYCETYAAILREAFPGAKVEVETGDTNGGTFVWVNGVQFGTFGSYSLDDRGEFGGAPEEINDLAGRIMDRWPSVMDKKLTILVTEEQRRRYHIAAATAGVTLSDVVREHLDAWADTILT